MVTMIVEDREDLLGLTGKITQGGVEMETSI